MRKSVAILQSSYIPWKGYFDIIHDVDEFIFGDDVQFTKLDWRNRNRIKTERGPAWLTIPVGTSHDRLICDVPLPATDWRRAHWRRFEASYARAPHFDACRPLLEDIWLGRQWPMLWQLNQHVIRTIARDALGLTTEFRDSREFGVQSRKQQRVLDILERTGADVYVSGPAARSYLEPARFAERGIELRWKAYDYPEYPQLYPPFMHEVTILDLLVHCGTDAPRYIWGPR